MIAGIEFTPRMAKLEIKYLLKKRKCLYPDVEFQQHINGTLIVRTIVKINRARY